MKSFDSFFTDLTSDQIWTENASMYWKPETFEKCAKQVWMQGVAEQVLKPIQECRKHVFNIIKNLPHDRVKKDWSAQALQKIEEKEKKEWVPASKEFADMKAKEALEIIRNSKTINAVPRIGYKQSIEEGDWLPKKQAPYPQTTLEEAYIRQRHLDYIKGNYEPRTGKPLPTWISEEAFNEIYDEEVGLELYILKFKTP